jgi:hypothetical protein
MGNSFVTTSHKNVLVNFDIENKHIEQLLGFALPQFPSDAGFYFNVLLNCELDLHPMVNYMEMYPMHVDFKKRVIEVTDEIWYNLTQLCYQDKLIMLDGEILATTLPISENKRFDEVWGNSEEMYSDIRKDLKP